MPRGVYRNDKTRPNLIGRRYERIKVVDYAGLDARGNRMWWCQCDCGSARFRVRGYNLKDKQTKSCGCLRQEASAARLAAMRLKRDQTPC